ncbi:MAG: clostripain-related cysteine peptidase [Parabacteroides sp.]
MRLIHLYLIMVGFFLVTSCNQEELIDPKIAPRTVLVYVAGDNNLSTYGERNIRSMISGAGQGHLNGGNLLVYFDPNNADPMLLQVKEGKDGSAYADTLQRYPEQNSMDPTILRSILEEVTLRFPAEKQGLVLWSHGTAWLPSPLSSYLRSFGDDKGSVLSIQELAQALPDHVYDFILFDACYMGSWEVLYALQNKADFLIASPTEVMASGFVYDQSIQPMFKQPIDLETICRTFYNYYNGLTGLNRSGAVALYDLKALPALASCCQAILQGKQETLLTLLPQQLQAVDYLSNYYHFLFDMSDIIRQVATDEAYQTYNSCLEAVVRYKATTPNITFGYSGNPQIAFERYSGLSMYLPQADCIKLNDWYAQNTAWGMLLSGL